MARWCSIVWRVGVCWKVATSASPVSEQSVSATWCQLDETPRPPLWRSLACAPARSTYSPGWAWSPCASTSSRRRWYAWSGSSVEPAACRRGWWSDLSVVQVSLMQAFDGEPLDRSGRETVLLGHALDYPINALSLAMIHAISLYRVTILARYCRSMVNCQRSINQQAVIYHRAVHLLFIHAPRLLYKT